MVRHVLDTLSLLLDILHLSSSPCMDRTNRQDFEPWWPSATSIYAGTSSTVCKILLLIWVLPLPRSLSRFRLGFHLLSAQWVACHSLGVRTGTWLIKDLTPCQGDRHASFWGCRWLFFQSGTGPITLLLYHLTLGSRTLVDWAKCHCTSLLVWTNGGLAKLEQHVRSASLVWWVPSQHRLFPHSQLPHPIGLWHQFFFDNSSQGVIFSKDTTAI